MSLEYAEKLDFNYLQMLIETYGKQQNPDKNKDSKEHAYHAPVDLPKGQAEPKPQDLSIELLLGETPE